MSKSIWRILLICVVALCLWRCGLALAATWRYFKLNTLIPVQVVKWDVEQLSWSKYAIVATLSYEFGNKNYESKIKLDKPYHLNRYAAHDEIKKISQKSWKGWIDAKDPSFSALEKSFPYLSIFYAFITLGVTLYFFFKHQTEALLSSK